MDDREEQSVHVRSAEYGSAADPRFDPCAGTPETVTDSVIRPIIRRKLHVSLNPDDLGPQNQDGLDLVAEVQMILLSELRKRACRSDEPIRDMSGFAATVTANACFQYLRSRFPVRTRQENRIRYILSHHRGYAIWKNDQGRWLCGEAGWISLGIDPVKSIPAALEDVASGHAMRDCAAYRAMLARVFGETKAPVLLDDLVLWVMERLGLKDRTDTHPDACRELSDPGPGPETALESASKLSHLWTEIRRLPMAHRKAVLLNLREPGCDNLIAFLPLTGTASVREIAEALEMPAEELAAIWNTLPWDDRRIAENLGITRQQVINLRQSARERLARAIGRW